MPMTYNRGEWAEAYAFVKLIGDGYVYAAGEGLDINYDKRYPIYKVFKNEIGGYYEINTKKGLVNIVNNDKEIVSSLKTSEFLYVAKKSLPLIIKGTKGKNVKKGEKRGTFEVPIMNDFLNKIGIEKFKGSPNGKTDIILEIWDETLYSRNKLKFSIKSFLGGKPTIMNASGKTNFNFKVNGMSESDLSYLNTITKDSDGKKWLKKKFGVIFEECLAGNYDIKWIDEKENSLYKNLRLIDSNLPKILSYMILYFYSHNEVSSIPDLTDELIKFNPLNLADDEKERFYKKKIFEYIEAVTFGMMPSKTWEAKNEINGGLLSVKKDGNIVCHHILYEYDNLKSYLFNKTKLETGDSNRTNVGKLKEKNNEIFFNLNLQLRYR